MELGREYFGPLWKYVSNHDITDIDYNGKEIWVNMRDDDDINEIVDDLRKEYNLSSQHIEKLQSYFMTALKK